MVLAPAAAAAAALLVVVLVAEAADEWVQAVLGAEIGGAGVVAVEDTVALREAYVG